MKTIIPYLGFDEIKLGSLLEVVCEKLKAQKIKFTTEYWANKGCTPEVPWEIIRIGDSISLFFAKGKMFKMYFENSFDGSLQNGISLGTQIEDAQAIDASIRYDDWEEDYVSDNGYWLEDDPVTHKIISISIFIKEVENDDTFYSYKWCEAMT